MPKSLKIALVVFGILFVGIPVIMVLFATFFFDSVRAKNTLKEKVASLKSVMGNGKVPNNPNDGNGLNEPTIHKYYKLKEDYIFYGRDELKTILTFKKDAVIHGYKVQLDANIMGDPTLVQAAVVNVKDYIQLHPNANNATIPLSVLTELTTVEYEAWYRIQPVP